MNEKLRNSNIELLRIIAMLMILSLHYFLTAGAREALVSNSVNYHFFHLMESLSICGVNLFVLITGFFSFHEHQLKVKKLLSIYLDVLFWGLIGYALIVLMGWEDFRLQDLIKNSVFHITGFKWFIKSYLILMLFIPFVNKCINSLDKKGYFSLLLICFTLFSIWPTFIPYAPINDGGYGFVHFIFLYIVGASINKFPEYWLNKHLCFFLFFVCGIIIYISSLKTIFFIDPWSYNSLFVVLESIFLFLFFIQLDFKSSIINLFAKASFGVYLIHTEYFFRLNFYNRLFKAKDIISDDIIVLIFNYLLCIIAFYVFCFILDRIKNIIFKYSIDKILNRFVIKSSICI